MIYFVIFLVLVYRRSPLPSNLLIVLLLEPPFPHHRSSFSSLWNLLFLLYLEPLFHPWVSKPAWSILQPFSWILSFCSIFFLGHSLTGSFSWNLCPQELSRLRTFPRSNIPLESSLVAFSWCLLILEPPPGASSFWCFFVPEPPPPGSFSALSVLLSSRA